MAEASTVAVDRSTGFVRGLGLLDSTTIVAGSMIGSGIFIVSGEISRQVGAPGWRAGGDDAKGRGPICLPEGGVQSVVGIPIRMDSIPGHTNRDNSGSVGGFRKIPRRALDPDLRDQLHRIANSH